MYYFSQQIRSQARLPKLKGGNKMSSSSSTTRIRRKKPVYTALPAINEPVILRYDRKAQFERECDDLTFGRYNRYEPAGTFNDWRTIQVFNRKKPRNYLKTSIKRGLKETFGEDIRASRQKLSLYKSQPNLQTYQDTRSGHYMTGNDSNTETLAIHPPRGHIVQSEVVNA